MKIEGGTVTTPRGFQSGGVAAGIKGEGKLDLGLLSSVVPCAAAGVFTTNVVRAAPVLLSQQHLRSGVAQAVVANSGCANACTGEAGMEDAHEMARLVATKLGLSPQSVVVASTGVIGHPLPMEKIGAGIEQVDLSTGGGHRFAEAILTTDRGPKEVAFAFNVDGRAITIGGVAKGAGMIHPNLATMLIFLTTDAPVEIGFLRHSLQLAAETSFNMLTVDGDTSTNDSVFILANGEAGGAVLDGSTPGSAEFQRALELTCIELSKAIVRGAEGASKLIEVIVDGAQSTEDARQIARTIAGSSLVKTAVHGNDPNWGRILAAAGRSGVTFAPEKADVYIGELKVMQAGRPLSFDWQQGIAQLDREEVVLRLALNHGPASAVAWGCNLSEEYVTINSAYTT
ncbi:MAG: bifunctional glutamate N-acetyltransferase/amino-acid acetyltransferase ArgJ [Chloroflexota bacterium]|nr:MAG: bifunctional glutamate N-acetyltransferase/amino-acid acetyltransferase ArgJ [Chloroflexota bacterium]